MKRDLKLWAVLVAVAAAVVAAILVAQLIAAWVVPIFCFGGVLAIAGVVVIVRELRRSGPMWRPARPFVTSPVPELGPSPERKAIQGRVLAIEPGKAEA